MPPKKASKGDKQQSNNRCLLPPATFSSSMALLGILPLVPATRKRQRPSKEHDNSGDPKVSSLTSDARKSTPFTQQDENDTSVVFTDGALELLRQCHGEFISLLCDGIVSSKEESSNATRKRSRTRKISLNGDSDGQVKHEEEGLQETVHKMMIVTPKSVSQSLHAMEFSEIASQVEMECTSTQKNSSGTKRSGGGSNGSMTLAEKRKHLKMKHQQMKKAFKNSELNDDLIKEQERLIASSVARAKAAK